MTRKLLVVKRAAAGDVLRTTTILHLFTEWEVDWVTAPENAPLLANGRLHTLFDDARNIDPRRRYDLVINLEDDDRTVREVSSRAAYDRVFGAYIDSGGALRYTPDSAEWFDLGLISRFGVKQADALKLKNRRSYQEILFGCLGFAFQNHPYVMPHSLPPSDLTGDIAVAPKAGDRWPTKTWRHFGRLVNDLGKTYKVNTLPLRGTLLEHLADVRQHRFVISPDSLPMHIALGFQIPCAAVFTCTSPWEIHDYGLLTKFVSPKLEDYFYVRELVEDAVSCIPYDEVYGAIVDLLLRHGVGDAQARSGDRHKDTKTQKAR